MSAEQVPQVPISEEPMAEAAEKVEAGDADTGKSILEPETDEETRARKEAEIEEALNCPCVDGMKEGPCGEPFIKAYRCFLESEADPQGSDCYETFMAMHKCIDEHPEDYKFDDEDAGAFPADDKRETVRPVQDETPTNGETTQETREPEAVAPPTNGATQETRLPVQSEAAATN